MDGPSRMRSDSPAATRSDVIGANPLTELLRAAKCTDVQPLEEAEEGAERKSPVSRLSLVTEHGGPAATLTVTPSKRV